jgi:pyruvate formate lyase activating enzyme
MQKLQNLKIAQHFVLVNVVNMKIKFIQPITLIDYPGKLACTFFLFGCNFRCGFCYNSELVLHEKTKDLVLEDIFNFLDKRIGQLEGVCFTGGEPLMTLEENFLKKIKEKGYFIKIDTNGSFPEKLRKFIDAGLIDYVSMDIKGRMEDYSKIVSVPVNLQKIEESIKIVSSLKEYEFRTTFVSRFHNIENILQEIGWVYSIVGKKISKFCLQGFKNYGKFIDDSFLSERNILEEELNNIKEKVLKTSFVDLVEIRI